MKKCCIVIPIYHYDLYDYEILSFKNLVTLYGNKYDLIFYATSDDIFNEFCSHIEFNSLRYNYQYYLADISTTDKYNYFCKSPKMYSQLKDNYEYLLIHQLDAFIFKDELDYWCNKQYDYIGAFDYLGTFGWNNIFNGGLSLRNISTCYNIAIQNESDNFFSDNILIPEDYWWTLQNINICKVSDAIKFSWNTLAELYYHINDFELPFGCHWINKSTWLLNKCKEIYLKRNNYNL